MTRGGNQKRNTPGKMMAGRPGISNTFGRMCCPQCQAGLWLRVKATKQRVHDLPAYTWDPYVTQGEMGLVAGKCFACGQIETAYRVRQRGKYGRCAAEA